MLKGVIYLKKDMRISADNFINLINTFKQNGWDIPESDAAFESRFYRFCERLSILDTNEQALVIELTKRFKNIDAQEYTPYMVKLLNQIHLTENDFFKDKKKLFVLPLLAPEDFGKTKSSNFMWYNFHDEIIRLCPLLKDIDLVFCDTTHFTWIKNLKEGEAILLLDDYIGSGETAVNAVNWLHTEYNVDTKKTIILSIAAQEQGLEYIHQNVQTKVFAYLIRKKGISDYYSDENLAKNIKIMTEIEKKLKVENKYTFGYNKSEALISLIKAPNNTFPVFWLTTKKHEFAPFLR